MVHKWKIDYWAQAFKAKTWKEFQKLAEEDEVMEEMATTLYKLSVDKVIREQCEAREEQIRKEKGYLAKLAEQENQLAELDSQIAENDKKLAEKDSQIAENDRKLAELDSQLAELDSQIAENDKKLAELDSQIAENDKKLAEKDSQLVEKDAIIAKQLEELEQLRRKLMKQ